MKYKSVLIISILLLSVSGFSQKIMTDGSITYSVSVVSGKDQPGIAAAFDGAALLVQMKGSQVRSDLNSNLTSLTTFYNASSKSAVVLKESGKDKYLINLNAQQWVQYNSKTNGIQFTYTDEVKTIEGYSCKKAIGIKKNGDKVEVYYTVDIKPFAPGYDDTFTGLPGLPLEYQISSGGIVVKYTAVSIQTNPVVASRFDIPKSGYKLLEYKQ